MPKFSKRSLAALKELHPTLQKLLNEAIKEFDFVILDAQRGEAEQERAFAGGFSGVHFGNSAHNWKPAVATDIAPYPINWKDVSSFKKMHVEVIKPIAARLKIPLRFGHDWDRDDKLGERGETDWPHIELHPWREWAKKSKLIGK